MEHLQPYIDTIVQALIGAIVSYLLVLVATLRKDFVEWLRARTTANQRDILHRLASEAMALAESAYVTGGGPVKLTAAINYVINGANKYGIKVSIESVRAAVEKAVLDYNAKVKGGVSGGNP